MKVFLIKFSDSKLSDSLTKYLTVNHDYLCLDEEDIHKVSNDDFIIWFIDDCTLENVANIDLKIKEKLKNKRVLFITTFEKDKIIIGPSHVPSINSSVTSGLLLLHQENIIGNEKNYLSSIEIPQFNKVLSNKFYNCIFFSLAHKIEEEISEFILNGETLNYHNRLEILDSTSGVFQEKYIHPFAEASEGFYHNKNVKQLFSDINFIEKSQKHYRYKILNNNLDNKKIGIIGGGTAGYLTAIALKTKFPNLDIYIIESEKIPIIGVGEATTPDLSEFLFEYLKFDKLDFYKKVEPTWKLGIKFFWGKSGDYTFNYPFGKHDIISAYLNGNIDNGSLNSILMSQDSSFVLKKGDKEYNSLTNPKRIDYALHLDNQKFVSYLKNKSKELGVIRIESTIKKIVLNDSKDRIDSLYNDRNEKLKYDLYIDCSGFKSILINKLDSNYVSYGDDLVTDSAITFNVPNNGKINPYTYAESMNNGWCWNIPLRDSNHKGYVYSSKFCSKNKAIEELQIKYPNFKDYKLIKFKSGRHNSFIKGNVVAIGNSYGFVEPLESTGIHMTIQHIQTLTENFEDLNKKDNILKEYLNKDMRDRWDYLKWFLSLHYKYNYKYNTPFWKYCRENIDVSKFQHIIDLYKSHGPLQTLNTSLLNNINKEITDSLFGIYGIDNILLGQGLLPDKVKNYKKIGEKLWNFNVNTWSEIAKNTLPLKDDIEILTQNPKLI